MLPQFSVFLASNALKHSMTFAPRLDEWWYHNGGRDSNRQFWRQRNVYLALL
jgi:hypothetical protein